MRLHSVQRICNAGVCALQSTGISETKENKFRIFRIWIDYFYRRNSACAFEQTLSVENIHIVLVPAGKRPQCGCASQKTPKTDDYYVQDLYLADVEEGGSHKVCCRRERQELMNMRVPLG